MPDVISEAESLKTSLGRTHKIKDDARKHKWQHIRVLYSLSASLHGHQEICGACQYRDEHPRAEYNGHSLQPPGYGAKDKMVGTDQCIKKHLRPKCQDPQRV